VREALQAGAHATKLVVSDLHLGDGHPERENWRAAQQAAWELLLASAADEDGDVELIVNGDCFDLLNAAPELGDRDVTDAGAGLAKLERIIAAHADWFAALRRFLDGRGRCTTFLIGNHDLELAFAPVRARVREAVAAPVGRVRFCLARAYRPLPDVEIEHGCQYDPWNRIPGLWDGAGQAASATPDALDAGESDGLGAPQVLELPFGSRYEYRVFRPIQRRFPYVDAFAPGLPQAGVLALACLYAPELVIAGAARSQTLYRMPPAGVHHGDALARIAEQGPAALFAAILPDVAALQAQVWREAGVELDTAGGEAGAPYAAAVLEGLADSELAALRAIFDVPNRCATVVPALDAAAALDMLARAATLRVALCGHTHEEGVYGVALPGGGAGTFVNTGTWHERLALPEPEAVDARLATWLREPRAVPAPASSATALTYALLRARQGEPASVELRVASAPAG
jgi:UDP-2,3-diacylglucosamine pyrophosphatase LpxH